MTAPATGSQSTPSPEGINRYGLETAQALNALCGFTDAADIEALWQVLITYAENIGANLLSYHHQSHDAASVHKTVTVRTHGFPPGWTDYYIEKKQHQTDPITQVFAHRIHPTRWSNIESLVPLRPAQIEYIENLKDWVMESFHVRWCELILMALPANFTLDDTDMRVLTCISKGMSDEDICGAMSASLESVRRAIRTVFKKMGVSDKQSAILRAIGAGLLERQNIAADAV